MWKTGTSSGHRDAWAVWHNGRYAIGVWAGRFSGAGHNDFVGREAAEPLLAELFLSPQFKTDQVPPPPNPLPVRRPLNWDDRYEAGPAIQSPVASASYVGQNRAAIIPVPSQRTDDAMWFLNGRLLAKSRPDQLELTPGSYELRCVRADGRFARVRFVVENGESAISRLD